MSRRQIVPEGNPVLREKAEPISVIDAAVRKLADEMWETLRSADGAGLAAPQVGVSQRLIIVSIDQGHNRNSEPERQLALVNPRIARSRGNEVATEACLSIPDVEGDVARAQSIAVEALDLDGKPVRLNLNGWAARIVQHEIDHLDGVLFTDLAEPGSLRRRGRVIG